MSKDEIKIGASGNSYGLRVMCYERDPRYLIAAHFFP